MLADAQAFIGQRVVRGSGPTASHGPVMKILVAVTGFKTPSDFERSKDAGLDMHLLKPLDALEVEILLQHVENRFARQSDGVRGGVAAETS